MTEQDRQRIEKSAEDYWFEYSHESIIEGLRAITEANFKQAIRACQSDCIESLMSQIEYQNKEANQFCDKIKELEFLLKEERNKAIDDVVFKIDERISGYTYIEGEEIAMLIRELMELKPILESLKGKSQ